MRFMSALSLSLVLIAAPVATQAQSLELPEYDDARRWNRAATLMTALLVSDLVKSKARGLTAAESGVESAKIFGPPNGWTGSDTPFVLFRGMYFNWMTDPDMVCELLEASEDLVRARCNRPYVSYFGETGESYGVTVADYEASSDAFASTIADYHEMDWEQRHDGEDLVITIRTR